MIDDRLEINSPLLKRPQNFSALKVGHNLQS